eukprot:scaffold20352_cov28-Tisochrysis_lutea.AAC.5
MSDLSSPHSASPWQGPSAPSGAEKRLVEKFGPIGQAHHEDIARLGYAIHLGEQLVHYRVPAGQERKRRMEGPPRVLCRETAELPLR